VFYLISKPQVKAPSTCKYLGLRGYNGAMRFESSGFDDMQRTFEKLERDAEELDDTHSVPIVELMPENFMQEHTKFASIQAMADAAEAQEILKSEEDYDKPEWNDFVKGRTDFESWEEMKETAGAEWVQRKLSGE
jgi:hypothetical protein